MRIPRFGRYLFGISVTGLAILSLVYGDFAPLFESPPAPGRGMEILLYGMAVILLGAGAGLLFTRTALASAVAIGAFGSIWALTRVRPVFLQPLLVGSWYGLGEALGPVLAAWILYASIIRQNDPSAVTVMTGDRALRVARILFGAACVIFGAGHFAYASYTATMVPAWFPGRTGIAYLTGMAHVAAGLGLIIGVFPRLAAALEALMIGLFGILVWLPSFFALPRPDWASPNQVQWSETLLSFLLAGSAWIVASSFEKAR